MKESHDSLSAIEGLRAMISENEMLRKENAQLKDTIEKFKPLMDVAHNLLGAMHSAKNTLAMLESSELDFSSKVEEVAQLINYTPPNDLTIESAKSEDPEDDIMRPSINHGDLEEIKLDRSAQELFNANDLKELIKAMPDYKLLHEHNPAMMNAIYQNQDLIEQLASVDQNFKFLLLLNNNIASLSCAHASSQEVEKVALILSNNYNQIVEYENGINMNPQDQSLRDRQTNMLKDISSQISEAFADYYAFLASTEANRGNDCDNSFGLSNIEFLNQFFSKSIITIGIEMIKNLQSLDITDPLSVIKCDEGFDSLNSMIEGYENTMGAYSQHGNFDDSSL
ncbi:MAG: hypothetical protein AB8B67_04935 [Rickettsiaceae bacterium]